MVQNFSLIMKYILCLWLALISYSVNSFAYDAIFFTPSNDCERSIIKHINESHRKIDIMVYSITNKDIAQALIEAKERGVDIRAVTDRVQSKGRNSVFDILSPYFEIRLNTPSVNDKIQHNKVAIYDEKYISTGSYNWTESATRFNSENCTFTDNEIYVSAFQVRFNQVWDEYNLNK